MGQLEILISVSRFEPALNGNRLLAVQRRGSNSLNSASVNVCVPELYA